MRDATSDDRLFLYWSSHGMREADGFYLITQDSPTHDLNTDNAIDPRSLAKGAANSKAKKVLIVLDACFSGEAVGDVGKMISEVLGGQAPGAASRRGIAVLASAHAQQLAQGGLFSSLLRDLLTDGRTARRWSDEDRFIDYDRLVASLADEIERRGIVQDFVPSAIGSTIELIPNPLYRPGLVAEIVEERAWRLALSGGAEHFDLAARGIEVGTRGWFFAGRRELLRKLVRWLEGTEAGIRIVTGPPGSGKSAVMGRLATLSDPEYRNVAAQAGVLGLASDDSIPLEGIVDVAIHAKGKTLDDCARAVAQALATTTVTEVNKALDRFTETTIDDKIRKHTLALELARLDELQGTFYARALEGDVQCGALITKIRERRVLTGALIGEPLFPFGAVVRPLLHLDAPCRRLRGYEEGFALRGRKAPWDGGLCSRHQLLHVGKDVP
jgi:hypothetical protein